MGLINETDKFVQYRYKVDEFKVMSGGGQVDIQPFQIVGMSIENDFEVAIFPIFRVQLTLDPKTYFDILKNKDDVKFKIRIQKYSKDVLSEKTSMFSDYINDTFSIFIDDDETTFNENLYKSRRKTDGLEDGEIGLFELDSTVEFFLFKDSYITRLQAIINKIIVSTDLSTCLAWLLEKAGCQGAMVSPLENNRSYSPLILPNQSILRNIVYLDTQYGFYQKGSVIFFALNAPYILNYKAGCTAYKTKEWKETIIIVLQKDSEFQLLSSSLIRQGEEKFYINAQDEDVQMMNDSITNNVISGTDTTVVSAFDDNIATSSSGAKVKGSPSKNTKINDTENKFVGSTITAQVSSLSIVVNISFGNINLECLQPNKQFSFIFEDTKKNQRYKGIYRISYSRTKFIKDGDDFSIDVMCNFKKVG